MAEEEKRQDFIIRFQCFVAGLVCDGLDTSEASVQAISHLKEGKPVPKYFSRKEVQVSMQEVANIDLKSTADGENAMVDEISKHPAVVLFSDFFNLCAALKPVEKKPATGEDPNFDVSRVERLVGHDQLVREASLRAMGELIDRMFEQGVDELAAESPARLRAVLVMLAHPGLCVDGTGDDDVAYVVLKKLLRLVSHLHKQPAARDLLVGWFAILPLSHLSHSVSLVQQFLTLTLLDAESELNSAEELNMSAYREIAERDGLARHLRNALRLLDIHWRANVRRQDLGHSWKMRRKAQKLRQIGQLPEEALGDSWKALPVSQFHNDAINQCDGAFKYDLKELLEERQATGSYFKASEEARKDFGILEFPFVLTPVSKVRMLNIETLLMQREEVRSAVFAQAFSGRLGANPFLVLKVRRTAVVEDALQQLGVYGSKHFRKPLKVIFDGEEGVDEGGVQKEFFQLLTAELYNEDFGMFEKCEDSRCYWFCKSSFEANVQFELFGTVLGLAIYNQVILDVNFPMAVYKKVIYKGKPLDLTLSDLLDFQPSLAQGLIALLEHDESTGGSFEEVFGPLRFVVEYPQFDCMVEAELMDGGKDVAVTVENREEYVQKYCDWIFNSSVKNQYDAFCKGFDKCINNTLFRQLFRPDELELVICGDLEMDFHALERHTQYQDGFDKSSKAIKWFWEVVHALPEDSKRQFLAFCTGCGRSPVGGLGRLTFVVSRAGPDTDALPTVHTCFNHLLLPDYSTKERMETRLLLAIQHNTGFGLM